MKVKSLLAKAAKCTTQEDVDQLLATLERAFADARPLAGLDKNNSEAYMEDGKPYVRFELNHKISDHYITMIRPEIRFGKLAVVVITNCMLDGKGMASQSWEVVDDMDDAIEATEDQTTDDLVKRAKEQALANHAELIQRVGVPRLIAEKAARQSW
ncbi:TPA: hypothetical protein ACYLN4_000543 [Burkholderia lata]